MGREAEKSWHRAVAEQSCPGQALKASQAPPCSHQVGLFASSSLFPPTKVSCGSSKAVGQGWPGRGPTSEQHRCAPVQLSAGGGLQILHIHVEPAPVLLKNRHRECSLLRNTLTLSPCRAPIFGRPKAHMPKFRRVFFKFFQTAHWKGVGRLKSSSTALRQQRLSS